MYEYMWVTAHEPRQKPISLPCRLDVLTRGLAHCLRAHSLSLRDNIGKQLAYAELTRREMLKNDTSPQVLLTPAVVFSQEEHFLKTLSMSMLASATEGQCASKKSDTVPTTRFL